MGSDSGNSGSDTGNKANSSLSFGGFLDNMAEDAKSIANGTAKGRHSAYDQRNAEAMAKETGKPEGTYLPGGTHGPRGGSYSPSALHAAGIKAASRALGKSGNSVDRSGERSDMHEAARLTEERRQAEQKDILQDTLGQNGFLKSDSLRAHQTSAALAQDTLAQDNRRTAPKAAPEPDENTRPAPEQRTARQHNNTQSDPRGAGLTAGTQNAATFGMGLVGTGLANGKTNKQQARNIERHNALKEKHAKTLEKIREKQAKNRQHVNDWLSEMSKPHNQPDNRPATQSAAETRAKAWDAVKAVSPLSRRVQDQMTTDVGKRSTALSQPVQIPGNMSQQIKVNTPESPGLDLLKEGYQAVADIAGMFGLHQTATNLERFLHGKGEAVILSKDEARQSPAVRIGEKLNQERIANMTLTGNTGNIGLNSTMRNLSMGETVIVNDNWTAGSTDMDTITNAIKSGGVDSAFAFGRQDVETSATFTATRKNNTVHIQGIVSHTANDTYNFHEGRLGDYVGATDLQDSRRGTPFETKSSWRQSVIGTVEVLGQDENGNILGNPDLTWEDID